MSGRDFEFSNVPFGALINIFCLVCSSTLLYIFCFMAKTCCDEEFVSPNSASFDVVSLSKSLS